MKLNNKKILVTGADGFIGSHLTEELVRMGCDVRAFVFYNSFNSWGWLDQAETEIQNSLEVVAGDVRDPHGIKAAMQGCDVVFHLAALISIPFSYHSPDAYIDTNVKGTLNVVQAARELGVGKIIHTSTSEVYGTALRVPITEEHPLQGQSPYSASKIGADQLAMSFYTSFETPVATIRPFNTYGPRQSARAVIPAIIIQIAGGSPKIKLGSLHPTRDFTFIADMVQSFIAVAVSDETIGRVVNAGSDFEISIGDTARQIAGIMGASVKIETEDQRVRPPASEVERLWADNTAIKSLTGWQPAEDFTAGLTKTIAWLTQPENLKRYKAQQYNI